MQSPKHLLRRIKVVGSRKIHIDHGKYSTKNTIDILINEQSATFVFGYFNRLRKWVSKSLFIRSNLKPSGKKTLCLPPPQENYRF